MRSRLAISTLEPTRYEVAVMEGSKVLSILGYAARNTKAVLFDYAREEGSSILELLTNEEADAEYAYSKDQGLIFGGRIRVAFTGRTERTAAMEA